MIKRLLANLLTRRGYYYCHKSVLPAGIDLRADLARLTALDGISTVLDVGSHEGQTALLFSTYFKNASIFGFEPISTSFRTAETRTANLPKIRLSNVAVGDRSGSVRVYLQQDSQTNSLKSEINSSGEGDKLSYEDVEVITLDDFSKQQGISQIDFLKIDTEGYELKVLEGAKDLLKSKAIKFILVEIGFKKTDERHTFFPEIQERLASSGMTLYAFYDLYHYEHPAELLFCNALFVNMDLYDSERASPRTYGGGGEPIPFLVLPIIS